MTTDEKLKILLQSTSRSSKKFLEDLNDRKMLYGSFTPKQATVIDGMYENLQKHRFSANRPDLPFKETLCERCNSVGIVQVEFEVEMFAICDCEQGGKQPWALPRLSELKNNKGLSLPEAWFMPPVKPKTQAQVTRFIREKINWWRETISVAELAWKNFNTGDEATK